MIIGQFNLIRRSVPSQDDDTEDILLEDGGFLLLEDGDKILQEDA